MALFGGLYQGVMRFSRQRHASYYLAALSFVESFILPFPPPDVMLAPMSLARPALAMRFAALTLLFSVLGGLVGYLIGAYLFEFAEPFIVDWGYRARFDTVVKWFGEWGFLAVLVAGFSPVPYKIFTIAAGVLGLALMPFIAASVIGRGLRFFLVAWCLARFGPSIEARLMQYIEWIGWSVVAALALAILVYYL